jgi:hypothetical protein
MATKATKRTATKAKKTTPKKTTTKKAATKAPTARAKRTAQARKAPKRRVTKSPAALPAAMAQEAFWVNNGEVLHTLSDLAETLRTMDDATFRHHVNQEKNDFATWVEEVLEEPACATDLKRAKTTRSTRTAVLKCLRKYNL